MAAAACAEADSDHGGPGGDDGDSTAAAESKADPGAGRSVADTLRGPAVAETAASRAPAPAELFLDRDWWLFRHVIAFLRSGPAALPGDAELLRQLYVESAYLRLHSLRVAVERRVSDARLPAAVLDPEFAAAPRGAAQAATGGAGPGRGAEERAEEALAWARWAREVTDGGGAPAAVPGPLSGALGGVRNAAALFAGAELDVDVGGGGFAGSGGDVEGMGTGLAELVGALERTRARGEAARAEGGDGAFDPLLDAAAAAGVGPRGGGGASGWWGWRDDLAEAGGATADPEGW